MNDQHPYAPNEPLPAAAPPLPPTLPVPNRTAGRRFWSAAAAGALAASIVWGAALALTGGGDGDGAAPDISAYRTGVDLCKEQSTKAVERLYTLKDPKPATLRHANMDRSECNRDLERKGSDGDRPTMLSASFSLHKKADPGPAFVAEAEGADYVPEAKTSVKKIPDLGERAYLVESNFEFARFFTLSVQDGGAVYVVKYTGGPRSEAEKNGDAAGAKVESALIEDTKTTLAALRRS
ncbi:MULTISPECIES: hypothetical protein [Streptomyces]|uniref:hypothetical protein n=1 Tax=Streptomyces TaxID=1883 RepID=UPI00163B74C7|nr:MULTISPECIES: hypothetical protein [Streptomyces]MBC2873626.1 hypothetical protein [Streptomyces sp. TYQ1024]UBI37940.1 hypothetical protein K7I03_16650 [Streptomyces mobaraensis]UKW30526.1 hypothetical protein MCU78_16615 [Streptomyces sp. TYQ1024]